LRMYRRDRICALLLCQFPPLIGPGAKVYWATIERRKGVHMPRADRLSQGGVKLLQEKQLAVIATVMADGSPHTTPVWVDVEPDGSHILINDSWPSGHNRR
jgi:hypothetical protein